VENWAPAAQFSRIRPRLACVLRSTPGKSCGAPRLSGPRHPGSWRSYGPRLPRAAGACC